MAFNLNGYQRGHAMGTLGTGPSSVKYMHFYSTNDDLATVTSAGYFNSLTGKLNRGDVLVVGIDVLDTTGICKMFVVTSANNAATVVLGAAS